MSEWAHASERLPDIGRDGRSRVILSGAGAVEVGRLADDSWNKLASVSLDRSTMIPEPWPDGLGSKRLVRSWRPLTADGPVLIANG